MNKKIALSGLITAGLITSSIAADITYYGMTNGDTKINSINFSDVLSMGDGYWAKPAIYQVASMGIMSGFSANSFSPTTAVTNEQAVTTILNATGKAKEVENLKMLVNNWSDKYIKYAMNNGLITEKIVYKKSDVKGDMDTLKNKGVFIRDIPITREEVATLLYRAFSLPTTSTDETKKAVEFLDKDLVDTARSSHVDAVSLAGIMVGDESGMFNPKSNLTRAEFAQIFKNCEEFLIKDLHLTKRNGFIDSITASGFETTDDEGNTIAVNCASRNIPVIRKNTLSGIGALKPSDEIEFFVDTSKQVVFVRVIDEGIYEESANNGSFEAVSKQGIVLGNSPYFYEISIKDKNGNVANYQYGAWTDVYKDGKETTASNILQGDTVYLEFDEIGDLVVIRGVTNAVITYGTVTDIDGYDVTLKMDADGAFKEYNLKKIPVYENGSEIDAKDLHNGKYIKLYSSQSELIKAEVVLDERTAENLYKGYISEINLIQDRIILRKPKIFKNDEWKTAEASFVTIPLDNDMTITYDGNKIEKLELGEKQVGKFAYIVTRQDTMLLEKIKSINIEFEDDTDIIAGEIKSYSTSSGALKLQNNSKRLYTNESTIAVIDGKIVSPEALEKGDNVSAVVSYEDGEYIVKLITSIEKVEEKVVEVYYGTITDVEKGSEVSLKLAGRYEDEEWISMSNRHTSFSIEEDTRIFSETEPLTFSEFNNDYKDKNVCVVACGDEAVLIGIADFGENKPYVTIGSIKEFTTTDFTMQDVECYNHEEDDWDEVVGEESVTFSDTTLITRNGQFARSKEIKEDQEVVVIRKDATSPASVILITD